MTFTSSFSDPFKDVNSYYVFRWSDDEGGIVEFYNDEEAIWELAAPPDESGTL